MSISRINQCLRSGIVQLLRILRSIDQKGMASVSLYMGSLNFFFFFPEYVHAIGQIFSCLILLLGVKFTFFFVIMRSLVMLWFPTGFLSCKPSLIAYLSWVSIAQKLIPLLRQTIPGQLAL